MSPLESCLPPDLRGPSTTITKIGAGLSGAGVYRVEANGRAYVLKISSEDDAPAVWRGKLRIQQLAANAGVAPPIVHSDEERRAVLSPLVVGRPFPAVYADPSTRENTVADLARTIRRVHEIPLPHDAGTRTGGQLLASLWSGPLAGFPLPDFVREAVDRVLTQEPPPAERALVLSHNDVNPTNLVYDGESLLLLDWETAGANDPFYDLAAAAVFLRMDDATCQKLIVAYDSAPTSPLPPRFVYDRRLVAVLCGVMLLNLARQGGHPPATGEETLATTRALGDFYQQLRTGEISLATAEGQWRFALALIKESLAV